MSNNCVAFNPNSQPLYLTTSNSTWCKTN